MGVAAYPTVDFGSGEVQMKAFLGVKLFAVNQQTDAPLASMALANYLSNETSQLIEFQEMGVIPSNKVVQESAEVQEDVVAKAVMEMSQSTHSVVMTKVPEMPSSMMHTKATSPQTNTWKNWTNWSKTHPK